MEQYRTEEEQVEALRRWWNENGKSTVAMIAIALAAGFGWQAWQSNDVEQQEQASDLYQNLLRVESESQTPSQAQQIELAEQLKSEFSGSSYAQFAALHLAAMAVTDGKLPEAEAQLRWVLSKADSGSDTAQVAQLRLARVLAANGDTEQALEILNSADPGPYAASYAVAEGDILLAASRDDEAREVYGEALILASNGGQGVNLTALQQKLFSLSPVPPRPVAEVAITKPAAQEAPANDTTEAQEE